jgi:hypothetical protein
VKSLLGSSLGDWNVALMALPFWVILSLWLDDSTFSTFLPDLMVTFTLQVQAPSTDLLPGNESNLI